MAMLCVQWLGVSFVCSDVYNDRVYGLCAVLYATLNCVCTDMCNGLYNGTCNGLYNGMCNGLYYIMCNCVYNSMCNCVYNSMCNGMYVQWCLRRSRHPPTQP